MNSRLGVMNWSFKNHGSRKIFAQFHRSFSLIFLAVMCISQSRIFLKAKKVLKYRFVYILI